MTPAKEWDLESRTGETPMVENQEGIGRPIAAWQAHLNVARTEAEVLEVARGYVGSWPSIQLHRIPRDFRPGFLNDGCDVKEAAVRLSRAYRSFNIPPRDMPVLLTMMAFFNLASARLAEIGPGLPPVRFRGGSMGTTAAEC